MNKEKYKEIAEELLKRVEIEEYCEKIIKYLREEKEKENGVTKGTLEVLEEGIEDFMVNMREIWDDRDNRRAEEKSEKFKEAKEIMRHWFWENVEDDMESMVRDREEKDRENKEK